jgi:hypothetical protein
VGREEYAYQLVEDAFQWLQMGTVVLSTRC